MIVANATGSVIWAFVQDALDFTMCIGGGWADSGADFAEELHYLVLLKMKEPSHSLDPGASGEFPILLARVPHFNSLHFGVGVISSREVARFASSGPRKRA